MVSALNPKLGERDASAILESTYAPKTGQPPAAARPVAIIVNHGMGQQVPYETLEGIAKAVSYGIQRKVNTATAPDSVIRRVRLGTEGKDAVETELVRAEIKIRDNLEVHIYESYWAPLTEGKVTLKDVMSFLFDAGWNGFMNTTAKKGYQRWMFGKEQNFGLPRFRLMVTLAALMLLLLALVFMNGVLAAAAASHAIGGRHSFPGALTAPLTFDFIVADCAAVLIVLGTLALPWLYKKAIKNAGVRRWLTRQGWLLVIPGAFLIFVAGFAMPFQLAGYHPENFLLPPLARWATSLASGHDVWITLLWGGELLAAYAARWFLIEYVGDVAAYIAAHTVSKFYELRQQIWQTAMKVSRAVYRAQADHKPSSDHPGFLYQTIIMVGHSLGSVIGYDVLNGLLLEEALSKDSLRVAERTRMFLTFGSPLDKTAFLFRTQREMCSPVQELAAAAVQPMIQDYQNRPREWVNLYSKSDIISGALDYYDPPNKDNAKDKTPFLDPRSAPIADSRAVQNERDPDACTPLAAHVEYWESPLFAKKLVDGITT